MRGLSNSLVKLLWSRSHTMETRHGTVFKMLPGIDSLHALFVL